jgi:2-polyprenyl-3-methyl-5-hydroxy-6-metoxy-1,4-benzoquinol methylase
MINKETFKEREICPLCYGNSMKNIYSLSYESKAMKKYLDAFYGNQGGIRDYSVFKDVVYDLRHCIGCNLLFQKFIPSDQLMFRLYEEYIDPEIKKKEIETGGRYQLPYFQNISREIEFLLEIKKNQSPATIKFLDYGMGWGKLSLMSKAYGCDSYGTELSPSRIAYAQANGIKVIKHEEIKDIEFDIINLSDVLEHVGNPMELIIDLAASLKVGGLLRISVPSDVNILGVLKKGGDLDFYDSGLNCVAPLEHINFFSAKSLNYMAEKIGCDYVNHMEFLIYPEGRVQKIKVWIKKHFLNWVYSKSSTNIVFQKR